MMHVAAWLFYCGALAAVLSAAAWAGELAARWTGRSARWAWLAALAGSVALPWLLRLMPTRPLAEAGPAPLSLSQVTALSTSLPTGPVEYGTSLSGATGPGAVAVALGLWGMLSVAALLWVWAMVFSIRRARRYWSAAEVDGTRVWLTENMGPAAVGVRRGMVVLPQWVLELNAELRGLLLAHEREHLRAGDPRLFFAGLLLVALMPWNVVLWLQLFRLRNAIELDCDARVLAAGANPRTYGHLLLEVGRRRSVNALLMATMAEPRLLLEQRIRRIAQWPQPRRHGLAVLASAGAVLLFATALSARDPLRTESGVSGAAPTAAPAAVVPAATAPTGPAIPAGETVNSAVSVPVPVPVVPPPVAADVPPALLNRAEVQEALLRGYPAALRNTDVSGTTFLLMFIDVEGRVDRMQLSRSSGYPALDEAAMRVVGIMRFSPYVKGGTATAVWVEVPVAFGAGAQIPAAEEREGIIQIAPLVAIPDPGAGREAGRQFVQLLNDGQLEAAVNTARSALERGELTPEVVESMAQQMAVRGFQLVQSGELERALPFYMGAHALGSTQRTAGMINFFHGYTLLKMGDVHLRQSSAAGARTALPLLQQATRLLEAAEAYEEQSATRSQLLQQTTQLTEVAEALIRRGD